MNRRQRRNRDADIHSRRLDHAATRIPQVFDHLNEQQHQARLTPNRGDGIRSKGSLSDPTGTRLLAITDIDNKRKAITDALTSIGIGIRLLEQACNDALGTITRPTEGEPICHHAGCDELVSSYTRDDGSVGYRLGGEYGGLCDSHRAKARRHTAA